MTLHLDDLRVRHLGECRHDSPLSALLAAKRTSPHYVAEGDRVLLEDTVSMLAEHDLPPEDLPSFEAAMLTTGLVVLINALLWPLVIRITCGGCFEVESRIDVRSAMNRSTADVTTEWARRGSGSW